MRIARRRTDFAATAIQTERKTLTPLYITRLLDQIAVR